METYSPEAEQAVLGGVLLRPQVLDEVAELVAPEDFYRTAHARIYQAMLDLWGRQEPVDLVTVATLLKERNLLQEVGGPVFLAALTDNVGTAAHAPHYARVVRDKANLRRFRETLVSLLEQSKNGLEDIPAFLAEAESKIYQGVRLEAGRGEPEPVKAVMNACLAVMEAQRQEFLPPGIATGFYDLDAKIGGLEPQNLYVIAARPGMGKTALAMNIALNVAHAGAPVLFLSLETSKAQLAKRILAGLAGIDHQTIRDGCLADDAAWDRVRAIANQYNAPLYLDDRGALTHLEVRARARRAAARWNLQLLVVDYLQLVSAPEAKSREQEVAAVSRSLKALAMELSLPVVVLAQLNRACEARTDKRPLLSDLRESGSVEQDADVVAFIYRDDYYRENSPDKNIAEILVRKNRHGATGTVKLRFDQRQVTFHNLATDEVPF